MPSAHPRRTSLVPSHVVRALLGKHWLLRSTEPTFELSPEGDDPPFPQEMLSLGVRPEAVVPIETLLQGFKSEMSPLLWAGTIDCRLIAGPVPLAVARVVDNPLTGPVLFIARVLPQDTGCAVVIYERRGEVASEELTLACDAIRALAPPLLVAPDAAGVGWTGTPSQGEPLAHLQAALDEPVRQRLREVLTVSELLNRHVLLSVFMGLLLRDAGFIESLDGPAYGDVVRALEGVVATFTRVKSDTATLFAASLLARGMLAHPETDDGCVARALQLSALLLDKAHGVEPARWEEAMLTQLLSRVARALRSGSEDYGDLAALAEVLRHDTQAAVRIVTRLVNDSSFIRGLLEQRFSRARVARCDLALALLQQIGLPNSTEALVGDMAAGSNSLDTVELLGLHERLPPEFDLMGDAQAAGAPVRFFEAMLCADNFSRWELERYYGIDMREFKPAVCEFVDRMYPQRSQLLFLRGFRSVKRVWLENAFSFTRPTVIPYPHEPPWLSLEAALTKGLGPFDTFAIGGLGDPLGMGRQHSVLSNEETWKTFFDGGVANSAWVLVLPDDTGSVSWEMQQLAARDRLGQVVLIMVPQALDGRARAAWAHVADVLTAQGHSLPAYDEAGAFVMLAADGRVARRFAFKALMDGSLGQGLLERTPPADERR